MKLVVVLLAVVLLVWLLLGSSRRRAKDARTGAAAKPSPQVEGMVSCAHCGVHLPKSLALALAGQTYCCVAHRDAGPRAP